MPSIAVGSGNGLHCYWFFNEFVDADSWRKRSIQFKRLARKHGLRADPNRTADIASVLRVPGTKNFKDANNPKQVTVIRSKEATDLAAFVTALERDTPELQSNLPAPGQTAGDFPPSSAFEIIKHCATIAHVAEALGNVGEPLWRDMMGVVKRTTEGEALCHEWSKGHPNYDPEETQGKIDRWTAGPTTCETFRDLPESKCQGCKQTCKSPIQLGVSKAISPIDAALPGLALSTDINLDAALRALNLQHFVARINGSVFVFNEKDACLLAGGMTFTAFRQFNAGMMIDGKNVPAIWLNSPLRRTYNSLVFDPSAFATATAAGSPAKNASSKTTTTLSKR